MNVFDFGAFQRKMQMLSHDKILFNMLFGAFHDTSRITDFGLLTIMNCVFEFLGLSKSIRCISRFLFLLRHL